MPLCLSEATHGVLRRIPAIAALAGSLVATSAGAQSLDDAIRHAIGAYPSIRAASANLESATAEIDRAKGALMPTLSLNASANHIENSPQSQSRVATPWVTWSAPINGRVDADVQRTESGARAAQAKVQLSRDDVALQVSEAWLAVVRGQQLVQLAQSNLAEHDAILGDVRKIVAIDAGRSLDLTQAQVRLDAARSNLVVRQAELAQAREKLSRFFQVPRDPGRFERYPALPRAVPATDDAAISQITSPALAQARAQVDEAQARVLGATRLKNPTLDFTLGRQYLGMVSGTHVVAAAQFSLPIYQGGQLDASIRAATSQLAAAQDTLKEVELVVSERVRLGYADWGAARDRLTIASQQRETGARLVSGYREQFRMARRTLLDLLNIQSELSNYQQAEALAQYDVLISQYRISAAMGHLAEAFASR